MEFGQWFGSYSHCNPEAVSWIGGFLRTFGIIFLAEMGDKTQIAAMTMAAEKKRPWKVFVAAAVALAAVSAIGVFVGTVLGQYVPSEWIKRTAGAAFIVIGILVLCGKF